MGVSASGKSVVGQELASQLGWSFFDGDDFHSRANRQKMAQGIALTDTDRLPWLAKLRDLISGCLQRGEQGVLACSALKESYRRILVPEQFSGRIQLVYLKATFPLVAGRMRKRKRHFMHPALLESQFSALQEPTDAICIEPGQTPRQVVAVIRDQLGF